MDIVTHAMMGLIAGGAIGQPEAAAAYMLGSVLPDLDALSRVFGKRVFLAAHQTWSHALPVIAGVGFVAAAIGGWAGLNGPALGLGLALGMASHSLLDVTNTYGITLFAPFSRRRYCLEWVFFIDAMVITATVATILALRETSVIIYGPIAPFDGGDVGPIFRGWPLTAYAGFVLAYWTLKWRARRRVQRLAPRGTVSLLPGALVPWHFLGCAREGDQARLFRIDAFTGRLAREQTVPILDDAYLSILEQVPEFRIMRGLSPAYHVIRADRRDDGSTIYCQDLRTRNFKTRFCALEVDLDAAGTICEVRFNA